MIDFSFAEKLVQLKDIFMSSPFFFGSLIVGLILLIIMIISVKKNRRIGKIIFIISWLFIIGFCIINYFDFFISIFDRFFGRVVEEIYFPSITVYTVILLFSNIILVYSLFNKKLADIYKVINLTMPMTLDLLFIVILDTIVKNNIDIYSEFDVYSDPKLIVLLEFSMFLFLIWIFAVGIIYVIRKYGMKKVVVSTYKEKDYEVIDTDEHNDSDIEDIKIEFTTDKYVNSDTEIIDLEAIAAMNNEVIEIIDI